MNTQILTNKWENMEKLDQELKTEFSPPCDIWLMFNEQEHS